MHADVDKYLKAGKPWQAELHELRELLLATELEEAFKWKAPCYTLEGKNVAMLAAFKKDCALSFFKGALLEDPEGLLEKPGENTQSARVIRFTDVSRVTRNKSAIKKLITQAIEVERAGQKVDPTQAYDFALPEELEAKLDAMPALAEAFAALTPGRQRAYAMFFAAAKQSTTRIARIEKYTPQILDGKGMNDCTCGLSKRMPACDGSHKGAG